MSKIGLRREKNQWKTERQVGLGLLPTGEATGAKMEIRTMHVANGPPGHCNGWTGRCANLSFQSQRAERVRWSACREPWISRVENGKE